MEICSNPEEASSSIRKEADVLLHDVGLAALLSHYGGVFPTGSYAMDLMTWRDLDLYLDIANVGKSRVYDLVHEMAVLLQPFWLEAKSMIENPEPDFPRGYFIGMETRIIGPDPWNIDLIVMSLEDILRAQAEVEERTRALRPEMRKAVLELKSLPNYLKDFFSADVYDAVIRGSVRSAADMDHWLRNR